MDRIKGITIEIGGDTTDLSKSLQGVNKDIKSTQTQLKDVERLLKLDPTNTELLRQKQELLGEAVKDTSTKLDALKTAQKQMDDQMSQGLDVDRDKYNALTREIAATEQSLESLKTQSNQANVELEKIGATAEKIGKAAGTVADKTKGLSIAAGAGVAALGGAALKSITAADDLNTLAKQSGLSTDELQKFAYAADVVDVSTDDIVSSLKKMRKNMDSTSTDVQDAWAKVGVSVTDADGNFRDSTEVFYDVLQGLSTIENETERDIVAMSLFGKNADSLAGIIDDGGASLRAMGEQAEALGLILSEDTLNSLNETNDKIDTMKANVTGTIAQVGATLADELGPIIEQALGWIQGAVEWIGQLDGDTLKTIATVLAVIAAISPVAGIVAKISGAISALIPLISTVMSFLAANPIVLAIGAAVAAIALLIKNFDKVKEAFKSVVNFFIKGINVLIRGLNKIGFDIPDWGIFGDLAGKKFGFNLKEIPLLASGGIVGAGGSAIVGEAGPELLTVGNNRAQVTPIVNVNNSGIAEAIRAGQGGQNISINFTGSLAQLARVLQPEIVAETVRRGPSYAK